MAEGHFTVPTGLPEAAVHSIPCKTAYSGPARIRTFFQPVVDVDQQKLQAAQGNGPALGVPHISAFRGRTLRGAEVVLPENFSGMCAPSSSSGARPLPFAVPSRRAPDV